MLPLACWPASRCALPHCSRGLEALPSSPPPAHSAEAKLAAWHCWAWQCEMPQRDLTSSSVALLSAGPVAGRRRSAAQQPAGCGQQQRSGPSHFSGGGVEWHGQVDCDYLLYAGYS